MHYYKFNIGDYASHTRHLSPLEDIAYRRLLDHAYTTELPLTKDIHQLCRIINMREYRQEVEDVLHEFFVEVEDGWLNNRVCKEIVQTGEKSLKAKFAAAMRWENARKAKALQMESERNADASKNDADASKNDATHYPLPITHNPLPKKRPIVADKSGDATIVLEYLNEKTGSRFKPVDSNIKLVISRLKDGATVEEMKLVIDKKVAEWLNDEKMKGYLRPSTLFNATNYAQYSGQLQTQQPVETFDLEAQNAAIAEAIEKRRLYMDERKRAILATPFTPQKNPWEVDNV